MVALPLCGALLSGCLASKGDIRLIQDEIRLTRSQVGLVDTSIARTNEQRRQQIATLAAAVERLSAAQERMGDSLRSLTARFASFQANTNGDLDMINRQMVQMQQLLGQNTRNLQETRTQLEALQSSGAASPTGTPPAGTSTTAPGMPGALTLFSAGREAYLNGAFGTARRSFEDLLASYPTSDQAPRSLMYIGETYAGEQNKTAADSVYQLVVSRYPKTDEAATSLYRHAKFLSDEKRTDEARAAANRIIKEYPSSDAALLARDLLNRIR